MPWRQALACPILVAMLLHETAIRLTAFLGVLAILLILERLIPWRPGRLLGARRWPANLAMPVLGTLLVRLVLPMAAVGVAFWAEARGFGLWHWVGAPSWLAVVASVLLLDLLVYAQHVVFHHVPLLWRLHRMHHADPELDATSGLRFHPLEILLSMLLKMAAVAALGAPAVAVLAFEVLLNATAMFNHAAIALPPGLERRLRWLLVTPEMHRIHHSELRAETDSDYGFCLSVWDRVFGTYVASPAAGDAVVIGVPGWREAAQQRIDRMLLQPFRGG